MAEGNSAQWLWAKFCADSAKLGAMDPHEMYDALQPLLQFVGDLAANVAAIRNKAEARRDPAAPVLPREWQLQPEYPDEKPVTAETALDLEDQPAELLDHIFEQLGFTAMMDLECSCGTLEYSRRVSLYLIKELREIKRLLEMVKEWYAERDNFGV